MEDGGKFITISRPNGANQCAFRIGDAMVRNDECNHQMHIPGEVMGNATLRDSNFVWYDLDYPVTGHGVMEIGGLQFRPVTLATSNGDDSHNPVRRNTVVPSSTGLTS